MSYPSTWETVAQDYARRIREGIPQMLAEAEERHQRDGYERFIEQDRAHTAAAERGAGLFLEQLESELAAGAIGRLQTEKADLVNTAVHCAGWLSATGTVTGREAALRDLIEQGYLCFHEQVPGNFVACYRLVAPWPR